MKKLLTLFFLALFTVSLFSQSQSELSKLLETPKSDVFLQGFYWNSTPGGIWWDSLKALAPRLASAGFSAVWIPPAAKGGGGFSMGYDIYDNYDLGEFNQKGSTETRFGSKLELKNMIAMYKSVGIELYYDAVLNHNGNADSQAPYECGSTSQGWVVFNPASGRFPKTAANFHPNSVHCDNNSPYHNKIFFEDLCYYSGGTGDSLVAWGHYLIDELGFDGFRIDAIKHIEPGFAADFTKAFPGRYIVGEHWSGSSEIQSYYNEVNNLGGNISLFDFPLRYTLKDMSNNTTGSFNMNNLDGAGLINSGMSTFNISTFVENHDFDRLGYDGSIDSGHDPILTDKDMAYAFIMFSEGRPSVFFKDYVDYGFGGLIDTLIWIRQNYLGGNTTKRNGLNAYFIREDGNQDQSNVGADVYVARRNGFENQIGGYIVINDNPNKWIDVWVDTELPVGTVYRDFSGKDDDKIVTTPSSPGGKNRVKLWSPARSFTIYVADTNNAVNNPPVLTDIPNQTAFTNSQFEYQLKASDANETSLSFSLEGAPNWLNVDSKGLLTGKPKTGEIGIYSILVKVEDSFGESAEDVFDLLVEENNAPVVASINDTTVFATKRYEKQVTAMDLDNDELKFYLIESPAWLSLNLNSGLLSGTPSIEQIGNYYISLRVSDGKGAYDSTSFNLEVKELQDTLIETYRKPTIDGTVNISDSDWLNDWLISDDADDDSKWNPGSPVNNELFALYATWDADSLYLGVSYVLNDNFNTMMLYLDAGKEGGITNFNSTQGYNGDYAKNFLFKAENSIDYFIAAYHINSPVFYRSDSSTSFLMTDLVNMKRGINGRDLEASISWNDIYDLGAGLIPAGVELNAVSLVAGGFNYGGGDSMPDNIDVDGDAGPDSLKNLAKISPDKNSDGIPDPTIIISSVDDINVINKIPTSFTLNQNYPNPFNPNTIISYSVPKKEFVTLKVYDILGKEITTLVNEERGIGNYIAEFNASNLSSGVYFYKIQAGSFNQIKKMLLIK